MPLAREGRKDVGARMTKGQLVEALAALADALDAANVPWAVIGGVAAMARGVARRATEITVVVRGDRITAAALVARLAGHGIGERIAEAAAFAATARVVLARHASTGVALDIVLGDTALEHAAITDSTPLPVGRVVVPVAPARALIVLEIVAGRPRDIDDATTLLAADRKLDVGQIRAQVAALAEAADAPQLHATLARVLAQVRVLRRLAPSAKARP